MKTDHTTAPSPSQDNAAAADASRRRRLAELNATNTPPSNCQAPSGGAKSAHAGAEALNREIADYNAARQALVAAGEQAAVSGK